MVSITMALTPDHRIELHPNDDESVDWLREHDREWQTVTSEWMGWHISKPIRTDREDDMRRLRMSLLNRLREWFWAHSVTFDIEATMPMVETRVVERRIR
jgi:hypothetical protein